MTVKQKFGYELKKYLNLKKSKGAIGWFAYAYHLDHDVDKDFRRFLIDLSTMEDGPEFELSYEELHQLADALIAGQDVKMP